MSEVRGPRSNGTTFGDLAASRAPDPAMRAPRRTRQSAKSAGTRFESSIVSALAAHVDERVERRARSGARDRGDVSGLRSAHGLRVVVECKDVAKIALGTWYGEADVERGNDSADVALIAHKRRGKGDPLDQWVTCTVRDLIALLGGVRVEDE